MDKFGNSVLPSHYSKALAEVLSLHLNERCEVDDFRISSRYLNQFMNDVLVYVRLALDELIERGINTSMDSNRGIREPLIININIVEVF